MRSSLPSGGVGGRRPETTAGDPRTSPRVAAEGLAEWLEARRFVGPDPYAGLAAPRARVVADRRALAQGVIQLTKRFPRAAGAVLGNSDVAMAKTMALVLSAYAVLDQGPGRSGPGLPALTGRSGPVSPALTGRSGPGLPALTGRSGPSARVARMRAALLARRTPEGGFGYEFPVVTRWGRYGAGEPNLISTVFALQGLADAAELGGDDEAGVAALGVARFALDHFTAGTTFLAYHAGSRVLVHNANALACGQMARTFRAAGEDLPDEVLAAARETMEAQRPDGAWPYAEHPRCGWVDTFHTLYILDGLDELARADPGGPWRRSFDLGLAFVRRHCLSDGGPLERPGRERQPLEGHTVGTALYFFARRTADRGTLTTLLDAAATLARPDGSFAARAARAAGGGAQGPAYPRWVGAHMLLGLAASAAALDGRGTR